MTYLKLFSLLAVFLISTSSSCNKNRFERETQIIQLLKDDKNIDVKLEKSMQIIVLQDNVCGACTKSVIKFIFSLNLENSVIILSNENSNLIHQFEEVIGNQKMIIDSTRLIDRYGLRYASDLFVSFNNGELDFWSFIDDESFDKIRTKMKIIKKDSIFIH